MMTTRDTPSRPVPGIVVVKGSGGGGIGDRLWSVLTGLAYCQVAGRGIHVDWADGRLAEAGCNVFPRLFRMVGDIDYLPDLPQAYNSVEVAPGVWSGRLGKSLHEVYVEDGNSRWNRAATAMRYSFDLGRVDHAEPVLVMWEFGQLDKVRSFLDPSVRGLGIESLLTRLRRTHLRLQPDIENDARQFLKSSSGTIGVHVRLTDEAVRQKGLVALAQYFMVVDRLLAVGAVNRVVLATDNRSVEQAFRRRYPKVATRQKWFPEEGEAIHLAAHCPDRWKSTRDALVEARVLSLCEHLVTQRNSAFSMMARIFFDGSAEDLIVLDGRRSWPGRIWQRARRLTKKLLGRGGVAEGQG